MIIVIWLKLCSTHTSFFKISFLCLWVNEVVVFKNFRSLLNLFQIDGPINEILLWPKLLFFRLISKIDDPINELLHWPKLLFSRLILQGICDLVLHIFVEETSRSFIKKCWTPHQIFTCSFTGRQFISLNSVAPIWCRELKLVSAIFHQIFIFSLNDNPSKTEKYFLFHLQSSFCSRDIQFFVIFPLSKLCGFKRAKGSGIIYEVMNWLDIIFGITQKLLYITSSNWIR